jgi:uncharacterized protein YoxC
MLVTISITVIAASIVVFTIFLIPVLLQIRRTARELEKLIDTTRLQLVPLSHDLTTISSKVNGILKSIHRQVDKVEDGITSVRDAARNLQSFQMEIQRVIEEPLIELAALVRGVVHGVDVLLSGFRRRGN